MSAKLPAVRLRHILEQIDGIAAAIEERPFEEIAERFVYQRAIERAVQIISEAAKELPPELRSAHPDANWLPIIKIGNLLRHEYYRIRSRDMWEIAVVHLPQLRPIIVEMLNELER